MKKDLGSLIEQALENISNDRQEVEGLLSELKEFMAVSKERYADSGQIAAKFVETLQRSNEQLVKVASLVHKQETASNDISLSEDEKRELFNILNEDS